MKVFLVRHGDADVEVPSGLDDDARPLTTKARLALPAHFEALVSRIGTPSMMWMSPLVRATQTATILAAALKYHGALKTTRALFPDSPVGAIDQLVDDSDGETIVLVGHQPSMGSAAAHFLGYSSFPRPFSPGTVVGVERNGATGTLLFYAPVGQPVATIL